MAGTALELGEQLSSLGLGCTVVSPTWVLPVPSALVKWAGEHDLVVTIEDGLADGGVGALVRERASDAGVRTPVHTVGLPTAFLAHASREQVVDGNRLTAPDIMADVLRLLEV